MCQQHMFSIMDQDEHSRYHGRISHMATCRTVASPVLSEWTIQSSTDRTVTAVTLPIQNLGGVARHTISRIVKLTKKCSQPKRPPSLGEWLLRHHFAGNACLTVDSSHVEGAMRLYHGYAFLIAVYGRYSLLTFLDDELMLAKWEPECRAGRRGGRWIRALKRRSHKMILQWACRLCIQEIYVNLAPGHTRRSTTTLYDYCQGSHTTTHFCVSKQGGLAPCLRGYMLRLAQGVSAIA